MSKLRTKHDVDGQVIDTVACCVKVKVPDSFTPVLDGQFVHARSSVERMLSNRKESSSKYYPEVPSVISKSLIAKYQRNKKCKKVTNLVLPLVGDKGRQIKLEGGGMRIPALFKKEILPVVWPRPVVGHVRSAEFFKRNGEWFASVCYNTPALPQLKEIAGTLGVDFNAVGNVAVLADPQTDAVQHLGFDPSRTKYAFRHRKANLQQKGKPQILKAIRKKQCRRVKYEIHVVSKTIANCAKEHRLAVIVEDLSGVSIGKIKRFAQKSNWAFSQLLTFLQYKCALLGVPLLEVNPAYSSRQCSRCGSICDPNGKHFKCSTCGHNDHRDGNAAFNLATRAWPLGCVPIGGSSAGLSAPALGSIGGPLEDAYAPLA